MRPSLPSRKRLPYISVCVGIRRRTNGGVLALSGLLGRSGAVGRAAGRQRRGRREAASGGRRRRRPVLRRRVGRRFGSGRDDARSGFRRRHRRVATVTRAGNSLLGSQSRATLASIHSSTDVTSHLQMSHCIYRCRVASTDVTLRPIYRCQVA